MDNLNFDKFKELIDAKIEEVKHDVECALEETEEYNQLTDELYKLEQSSVAFYKLTLGQATNLSEDDVFTCRRYLKINQEIEQIGWKLMYIQGIKDSFEIIEKILNS